MATKSINLPGIVEVRYLNRFELSPHILERAIAGLKIVVLTEHTTKVNLVDTAEMTIKTIEDNHQHTEEVSVKSHIAGIIPQDILDPQNRWLCKTASGQWWLIGSRESKNPAVKLTRSSLPPSAAASDVAVEITYSHLKAAVEIIF